MDAPAHHAPLAGIRVLELAGLYAAPTTGRLLRDLGADVVKVEDPAVGDGARAWVPQRDGVGLGFTRLNSGKRSIAVDLREPSGQDLVRRLAAEVDVVLESFRPGRLESWGLGWEGLRAVNPGLVMARISGFGQDGPYRARPGFGTIAEAMSGFAFINGWPTTPPTAPPFGFADSIAGFAAAFGIAAALYDRERTGEGELVDVALYEPLMFILGDTILRYTALQEVSQREGNSTGAASPRGIYQTSDGAWIAVAASAQRIAQRLFVAMDRPELCEDPRFATPAARLVHDAELQEILTEWIGARTRADALAQLEAHEVVAAPVNDASDVVRDPHFLARTLRPVADGTLGDGAMVPGPPLRTSRLPLPSYPPAPRLGEDTAEVVREYLGD